MNLQQVFAKFSGKEDFFSEINKHLRNLCSENPEFVYTFKSGNNVKCKYNGPAIEVEVDENGRVTKSTICGPESKGCIFGQALQRMGWDDVGETSLNCGIKALLENLVVINVPPQFSKIQAWQDDGVKWGDLLPLIEELRTIV